MPDDNATNAAYKQRFLDDLNHLVTYIEDGMRDYLKDNSLEDYIDVGDFDGHLAAVRAIGTIRELVKADDYPWWEWEE